MKNITDIEILQQTIDIQSCLISGHSIEAIFRNESNYILDESKAHMVGLCLLQKDSMQLEFIIEKTDIFHKLLRGYHLQSHTLVLDTMRKAHTKAFSSGMEYITEDSLDNLLSDSLAKHKIKDFEDFHVFSKMITFPLYSFENQLIGCIFFCFLKNKHPEIDPLSKIRNMVQTIIRPFHDDKKRTFQGKCIQIINDIPILTSKEKHILKNS